jgi:hypothetical protein
LKWDAGIFSIEENDTHKLSRRIYLLKQEKKSLESSSDTVYINKLIESLTLQMDSIQQVSLKERDSGVEFGLFDTTADTTVDGWLAKYLQKRIDARAKEMELVHQGDAAQAFKAFIAEWIHALPQLFFVSLPFFAFLLKLLYWRSKRKRYVEHFIFSTYLYAFLFVLMLFYFLLNWGMMNIGIVPSNPLLSVINAFVTLYPFLYLLLSMKRFYQDRWWKLIFRFIALLLFFIFVLILLSLIFTMLILLW